MGMEGHGASSRVPGTRQLCLVLQVGLPDHSSDLGDLCKCGNHLTANKLETVSINHSHNKI